MAAAAAALEEDEERVADHGGGREAISRERLLHRHKHAWVHRGNVNQYCTLTG